MNIKFWGTRGSIASPGRDTVKYGGNTSCVEVSEGENLVVFDAGTGIRPLGLDLLRRSPPGGKIEGHIFVTHFHLDHIQGFPFFVPLYVPGNSFTIYGCEAGKKLESVFMGQMSPEYFPVTLREMAARIKFVQLTTRPVDIGGGWTVHPTYVNHPGLALGYRLDAGGRKVAYVTDNEPFRYLLRQQGNLSPIFDDIERGAVELEREDATLAEFLKGVDVLIHDAQYTQEEYKGKISWGHSFYEFALQLAVRAGVKHLVLFHHDPLRLDPELDELLAGLRRSVQDRGLSLKVDAAWEGLEISLP